MKRIAALLAGCMLAAGTFVSCGEDDISSSGTDAAGTTGTSSEVTSESTTDAATTAAVTAEKTSAEPETTAEKTAETSEAADNGIEGSWRNIYCITDEILTFDSYGMFSDVTDYTGYMCFGGDKTSYVGIDADYEYDDGELRMIVEGKVACEYSKFYDFDSECEIDGLYIEIDPESKESTFTGNDYSYYRITEGKTERIKDGTYTLEGDKLIMTQTAPEGEGVAVTEYTCVIEDGSLRLTEAEYGDEIVLERAG